MFVALNACNYLFFRRSCHNDVTMTSGSIDSNLMLERMLNCGSLL